MNAAIETRVIKIGNSQGIRIPKPLLEQLGLKGRVEMKAEDGALVIRAVRHPREGWDEQFAAMHAAGEDCLLDEELLLTSVEKEEWEW